MASLVPEIVTRIASALAEPVLALTRVEERVYGPYLLGAALLACGVWWKRERGRLSLLGYLFPARIWLHPSALFEVRWMAARAVLQLLFFGSLSVSSVALFARVRNGSFSWWGPGPLGGLQDQAPLVALLLVTLFAFVAEDFVRYWVHRAFHRVPLLWELHKLHHSAEVLTPLTIYRTHPLEGIVMQSTSAAALGCAGGLASWFLGTRLEVWQTFGVVGFSFAWNLLGSNLRHSHVFLRYPSWLESVLLSPASHQIHHSRAKEHHGRNLGAAFSIWDHAFGTFTAPERGASLTFGIDEAEKTHENEVLSALYGPLAAAFRRITPRRTALAPGELLDLAPQNLAPQNLVPQNLAPGNLASRSSAPPASPHS